MSDIPHAVLSEAFEQRMGGRRLVAALFLTFRFDPGFFAQEILPIFLNIPLSHASVIRLVQLDEALKSVPGGIAVYYDQNGLVPEAQSIPLDVRRTAVRHRTGIFHPKNVFALVEGIEPDEDGRHKQALLVACLSANLTRAGWWQNVETCHIEEITTEEPTRVGADLISLLDGIERRVGDKAADGHETLRAIRAFLNTCGGRERRSAAGSFHTHFFRCAGSVPEFLRSVTGSALNGMNLEIISPYFDKDPPSAPVDSLLSEFQPRELRILLPRGSGGEAQVSPEMFNWIKQQPGVHWARLPPDRLSGGKSANAVDREVHAKVYRFFQLQPKREILFVGSVNLTRPAHQAQNLETGFLVEIDPVRRPDWWLIRDVSKPVEFVALAEDTSAAASGGTRLSVRFYWNTMSAEAFWDDLESSPTLRVDAQGIPVFGIPKLAPKTWTPLEAEASTELARVLRSTSFLTVMGDGKEPGLLLVQEEGMSHRPSLLLDLPVAEILRYWTLLNSAQRAAFLEAHGATISQLEEAGPLVTPFERLKSRETFFDRFAGIFLSFGCLERSVRASLTTDRTTREAEYRLFGQKHDSLGNLLKRVEEETAAGRGDLVEHYVIALCAKQVEQSLRRDHNEFFLSHARDAQALRLQLETSIRVREGILARNSADMPAFLDWFDRWFLRRAAAVEESSA